MEPETAATENNGIGGAKGEEITKEKSRTPERANMGVKRKAIELQTPADEEVDEMDIDEEIEDEEADTESEDEDEEREDADEEREDADSETSDFEDDEQEQESRTIEPVSSVRGQAVGVRRSKRLRTSSSKAKSMLSPTSPQSPSLASSHFPEVPGTKKSSKSKGKQKATEDASVEAEPKKPPSEMELLMRQKALNWVPPPHWRSIKRERQVFGPSPGTIFPAEEELHSSSYEGHSSDDSEYAEMAIKDAEKALQKAKEKLAELKRRREVKRIEEEGEKEGNGKEKGAKREGMIEPKLHRDLHHFPYAIQKKLLDSIEKERIVEERELELGESSGGIEKIKRVRGRPKGSNSGNKGKGKD